MGNCFSSKGAAARPARKTEGQKQEAAYDRKQAQLQDGPAPARDYETAVDLEISGCPSPVQATSQSPQPEKTEPKEPGEKVLANEGYQAAQQNKKQDPHALEVVQVYLEAAKRDAQTVHDHLDRKLEKDTDAPRREDDLGQDKDHLAVQTHANQETLQHALSGALAYIEDVKKDVQIKQENLDRKLAKDADDAQRKRETPGQRKGKKIANTLLRETKDFTFGGLGLMLEVI